MNNLSVLATFKGYGLSDTISALRSREITYNILTLLSELGVDYTVANNLYFKKEVKNIKSIKLSKNRIVFLYKMLQMYGVLTMPDEEDFRDVNL